MKSLVLREKEEKVPSEFSDDEAWALIQYILDAGKYKAAFGKILIIENNLSNQILVNYALVISRFHCNIWKMFAEGLTLGRKVGFSVESLPTTMALPREIRGAPPQSLIVKVSEVMGSFKTLRKMASFWCRTIAEVSHSCNLFLSQVKSHIMQDLLLSNVYLSVHYMFLSLMFSTVYFNSLFLTLCPLQSCDVKCFLYL